MRVDDTAVRVDRTRSRATIRCTGELDVSTCKELRAALDDVLGDPPRVLELDCSGLSLLTAAGIKCLVEVDLGCRRRGVELHMLLSREARKVLDVVGLWWLGVIRDGISAELALQEALRSYADRSFEGENGLPL